MARDWFSPTKTTFIYPLQVFRISANYGLAWRVCMQSYFSTHLNSCLQSSLNMVNIRRDLQFIVGQLEEFFSGKSFKSGYKHQIGMNTPCGLLIEKKTLADRNVNMAAIFQDVRHFDTQNIHFWIKPQIIVLFQWYWYQIIDLWLWRIWIFILRDRKFMMAAIFQDGCLFHH